MHRAALLSRQVSRAASSAPLRSSSSSGAACCASLSSSSSSTLLHRLPSTRLARSAGPAAAWSPRLQARRWYADNAAEKKGAEEGKKEDAKESGESNEAGGELEKVKTELEAKNKEVVDLKDKYLRSVADFRNLQERSKRDQTSARDFAITKFAKDLVESIDNLDRALVNVPAEKLNEENKDLKNLYDGLKMTETVMLSTMARHGLERFDPAEQAEKFDPNRHEAAFMAKMEGKEDGTVFNTMQKGFALNGRIIRAAKVGVVKNS